MALARATMALKKGGSMFGEQCGTKVIPANRFQSTSTRSGAILPEPKRTPFGFVGVIFGVSFGLFIGASLSKMIANFLEENDLFVPSDDDDDDD